MLTMSATDDYFEFIDAWSAQPAWRAHVRTKQLQMSAEIFLKNAEQLTRSLGALSSPAVFQEIGGETKVREKERAMTEVMRLLFNFLSAARSLNHHLDKFREHYDDDDRRQFNKERSRRWRSLPITALVQNLRNLFVHDEIPVYELHFSVAQSTLDVSVTLDVDSVLGVRKWNKADREFLERLRHPGRLQDIVVPYTEAAQDFLRWLFDWHQKVPMRADLEELERLEARAEFLRREMEREISSIGDASSP